MGTGEADDDYKGYGLRGANILRIGKGQDGSRVVHLIESICKSHRLIVRSSYAAEMLAAAHSAEDAYPTIVTLEELSFGVLSADQLRELWESGGLRITVTLTTDAESVFKSLSSKDLKTPTEKTLLGHVAWLRQLLDRGLIWEVQWGDTRDMTADEHTKGSIDRALLLAVMDGKQSFSHTVK